MKQKYETMKKKLLQNALNHINNSVEYQFYSRVYLQKINFMKHKFYRGKK